jgi:hypothetical protein
MHRQRRGVTERRRVQRERRRSRPNTHVLATAQASLVPKLTAQMGREARRRAGGATPAARRVDFGIYEGAQRTATPLRSSAQPHLQRSASTPLPLTHLAMPLSSAGMIQDEVPRGCFFSSTYHDKARRNATACTQPQLCCAADARCGAACAHCVPLPRRRVAAASWR